jgi:hypothetical protein
MLVPQVRARRKAAIENTDLNAIKKNDKRKVMAGLQVGVGEAPAKPTRDPVAPRLADKSASHKNKYVSTLTASFIFLFSNHPS